MKASGKCPKCGSDDIIHADAMDGEGVKLRVVTHDKPEALLFKGTTFSTLTAHTCAACGYTELYAAPARPPGF